MASLLIHKLLLHIGGTVGVNDAQRSTATIKSTEPQYNIPMNLNFGCFKKEKVIQHKFEGTPKEPKTSTEQLLSCVRRNVRKGDDAKAFHEEI